MTVYYTSWGQRLVLQGSQHEPAPVVDLHEALIEEAIQSGLCSVCEEPTPPESLDASGRCQECQP